VLTQRILSSIVLIPVVLGATYVGGPWFAAVVSIAALVAGCEFYRLMRQGGFEPSWLAGLGLVALLLLDAYYPNQGIGRWGIAGMVVLSMVCQILKQDTESFLANWALMLAGAVYVGGLLGHLILLRNLPGGLHWMLLSFAATWSCDSAAYCAGNLWGRHSFFSHVSPHKTLEGAIAGILIGILVAAVGSDWLGLQLWQGLALGAVITVSATFGDLAESLIKRQVGVKDSSTLIPGHGGMLDRIDSLLFVGTAVYYFVTWVVL
jgi:phosphatidate cytidylyltransferase